jgi:hypothetical protein
MRTPKPMDAALKSPVSDGAPSAFHPAPCSGLHWGQIMARESDLVVMPSNNSGMQIGYLAGKYPGRLGWLIGAPSKRPDAHVEGNYLIAIIGAEEKRSRRSFRRQSNLKETYNMQNDKPTTWQESHSCTPASSLSVRWTSPRTSNVGKATSLGTTARGCAVYSQNAEVSHGDGSATPQTLKP